MLLICAAAAAVASSAPAVPSTSLALTGDLDHAATYSVAELRHLAPTDLPNVIITTPKGATGKPHAYRGVLLRDLLDKAGLHSPDPHGRNRAYLVAYGTDGYQATFSWNELFNTPVGKGVLVVYQEDGQPLDARQGQLTLLSSLDLKTGPRHVRNLNRVEVRILPTVR